MESSRQTAADACFEAFDFGAVNVESANGWEHSTASNEWTRAVFVAPDEQEETTKLTFTVRFAPGESKVVEAYAIDNKGCLHGHLPHG